MLRICAGRFKGKKLKIPPESVTRPSSDRLRKALFNILSNRLNFPELRVLDGFAGSGALGLEAISRGTQEVMFCEQNPIAHSVLKENIKSTVSASDCKINLVNDFFQIRPTQSFDLIFLDPPYDQDIEYKALNFLSKKNLIAENGVIFLEQKKSAPFKQELLDQSFHVIDQRIYGKCQVLILQLICNPSENTKY